MLSLVKILLKGEVGGRALINHGNYIVGHGKNHGIVFLNFCGNPEKNMILVVIESISARCFVLIH